MYSLMIVDDEVIIRDGLRDMVNWSSLGFEVVACIEDGREAIDYLSKHDVHAILADIKMADVSGIEIARYVADRFPATRVVIMSGYRNFDFALNAIEYRVYRYLLKPIDFDELENVFTDLEQDLTSSSPVRNPSEIDKAARRQFVTDLILGIPASPETLRNRMSLLGIDLDLDSAPCALFLVETILSTSEDRPFTGPRRETITSTALSSIRKITASYAVTEILAIGGKLIDLAVSNTTEALPTFRGRFRDEMSRITESLQNSFGIPVEVTLLATCSNLLELHALRPGDIVQRVIKGGTHSFGELPDDSRKTLLDNVLDYLHTHYSSDISLADAASRASLSPAYFSKYFRDHIGKTFTEYLADIRIEQAIQLMHDNRLTISEIGRKVGYPNSRYFTRVFRKTTGYNPRDYRAKARSMSDSI